jgi:autotransporter-associated beta strand protein
MNATTAMLADLHRSAGRIISSLALALLAASASAQTVGFTANTAAEQYGTYQTDNGGLLNIGRAMTVSGSGIEVFQLGVFDYHGEPLAAAHTVTLFDSDTQTALASVTVPAGTAAPLINAFRFAPLATPVFLPAGNYSILAYQMTTNDPYGNGNAPGFNGGGNVSPGNGIYDFTAAGSPDYPNGNDTNQGWSTTDGEEFAAVSFTYTNVPPATGIWTGGGANNYWSTSANWNGLPIFPTQVTFAGSTRLANTNDNSGITVDGITFDAAAGAFVLNGNDITLAGNIGFSEDGIGLSVNPATPVTQTINLNMALTTDITIDTPTNGNLSLNGAITSENNLFKLDAGTLTLVGTNAVESMDINGGTNIIAGNTTLNGNSVGYDRSYLGDGDTINGCTGTLIIQPGGVFNVIGNFNDSFVIGRDSGSGTVIQNGGTFTFDCNEQYLWVGATSEAGTTAAYYMNGGLLDMSGNTLGIALGNGVLTTCAVNQVNGVITNVGNLWVGWGSGHGVYTLTGGSIYIGSTGITTTSGNYAINLGGGTVGAEASWSSSLNMTLTGSNGPVTFDTGGNTITLSGVLSGNGGLTVTDSGTLELSGGNTYTGDTTVNSGSTLQLDLTGSSLGAFRLTNGALLNLNYSGTYAVAHFYTNGVVLPVGTYNAGNLPGFITGSGNLQVASSISTGVWTGAGTNNNWSTAGNWNQNAVPIFPIGLTFAGNTQLANNNDLTGITASSITFDSAAGAFRLNGNGITLAGNIDFNGNPASPVTQTINLNMAWSASETIDTPANGNLTLDGAITSSSDTSLIKIDTGTLTLGSTNAITSWDLDGGTTTITGNTTINGDGNSRIYVGDGDYLANCNGTLVIQPGAVLTVTGNFADQCVIGRDSGSGTIVQNGGTFTFNPGSMPAGNLRLLLAATGSSATQSAYDMNAGLLDMTGDNLSIGWGNQTGSTGVMLQIGGVITNVNEMRIPTTGGGSGLGVYTLSGGKIYILGGGIVNDGPSYVINLGGGTVVAETSWSSSLNMNLTNLNGSVTFDTGAGNNITLSGALSGNGGLIVTDSGTLELQGANTYTGDTIVNTGSTLQLDVTGGDPARLRLANGAFLNLNNYGNYTVLGCYTNGVALPVGTYNAGNLGTFIQGTGNLVVAATVISQTVAYTANFNASADYFNNFLNMGHIFSVSGAGIEVFQLGYFDYQNHPLASSHAVTLFSNETAIASVTIPAGTATNLINSFAFEPLSTPIYLPPGQYTVLAYGIDDNDPNGEGANIGFNGSANLSVVNACYDWTTQGSPDYPGGPGDAPYNGYSLSWDNNTATASFTYANGIEVLAPPVVNPPVVSGGNLILTGSGGIADAGYTLLTTTNLATPLAGWATNSTGTFSGTGAFSNSIPISQSQAAQFFLLRTP